MASWQLPAPPPPKPQLPAWQEALYEVKEFWNMVGRWFVAGGVLVVGVGVPIGLMALVLGRAVTSRS